jgi:4-alpha-glucanotransferase
MTFKRSSGILLHPTSLPGPDGIGDLGPEAYRWVDFIADSGCTYWQILPLNPTGYADSPYQCFSAFAGNPYLVSAALLLNEGLLLPQDLADRPSFPDELVDFGPVIEWKRKIVKRSYEHFIQSSQSALRAEFQEFQANHAGWLPEYALFTAIKEENGGCSWVDWPQEYRSRVPAVLEKFKETHARQIDEVTYAQFLFFRQWKALKNYANDRGLLIIGDIPIFIAHDSADAWVSPHMFTLNPDGSPSFKAGVPPDGFSETGQLWGNPHYRWEAHRASGYEWWINRITSCLETVDIIRLDHFIGFCRYFEIPGDSQTAEIGEWKQGPGEDLFQAIKDRLGKLPLIAEDLGAVVPSVTALLEKFELPGMRILTFAFYGDSANTFLPHHYVRNTVAYTGVHDNDTAVGWFNNSTEEQKAYCKEYLGTDGRDIAWDLLRSIWSSVANMAIAPMQDFLRLGTEARMNYPGTQSNNWRWRMRLDYQAHNLQRDIRRLNQLYSRMNQPGS